MSIAKVIRFGLALGVLGGCSHLLLKRNPQAGDSTTIHIVATTDLHGYILPQKNPDGSAYGGIDIMSGLFQIAKQADPETLFLDSGDLFQGTIISNASEGSTVVTWMNYAGYTTAAIGNHDFDFGPGNGDSQVRKAGEDPLGALKARIAQAQFKFLSANICSLDEDPGKCADVKTALPAKFTQPYLIKTVHGIKVGILGLTTPETPNSTFPGNVARLKFFPLADAIERYVPTMLSEGAQTVIVVMHEGAFCQNAVCNPQDPLFKTIDALSPSVRKAIPLILAGHTHNFMNLVYNGVRLMINGSYGRSFGYITVDQNGDSFVASEADSVNMAAGTSFLGQKPVADANAFKLIAPDIARADAKSAEVLGQLASPLNYTASQPESTLGDFVTDAIRLCVERSCADAQAADISFQNGTGLRIKHIDAGQVTYGQIFELLPFDNSISVVQMKGSQVHDLIDAWYNYNKKNMNAVSGLHITYSDAQAKPRTIYNAAGESQVIQDPILTITNGDGSAFDENKIYRVAMADYLAAGGSGSSFIFKNFQPAPVAHLDRQIRDAVVDYLKAHDANPLDYKILGGDRVLSQ